MAAESCAGVEFLVFVAFRGRNATLCRSHSLAHFACGVNGVLLLLHMGQCSSGKSSDNTLWIDNAMAVTSLVVTGLPSARISTHFALSLLWKLDIR